MSDVKNIIKLIINDFKPIGKANINLGKVTVIGGENSSGKSTSSKLLFTFLKSVSSKRGELAIDTIVYEITGLLFKLNDYVRNHADLNGNFPLENIFNLINRLDSDSSDLNSQLKIYTEVKELYSTLNIKYPFKNEFNSEFEKIDKLIKLVNENQDLLYYSVMRKLLKSEFASTDFNGKVELNGIFNNEKFNFAFDFAESDFNNDDSFIYDGWIPLFDVIYIDSLSVLDLYQNSGLINTEHIKLLAKSIESNNEESNRLFDDKINKNIIEIENKIAELIDGEFIFDNGELFFVPNGGLPCSIKNTASGIKQIGLIQLLLKNRRLKENSFLIIDEPEVNLHPDWQFKLANILVFLASTLNISIYINTHSPLLIEAINTFVEYYGISDETFYYLTESDESGHYIINKVMSAELYKIYDNLGRAYDFIDIVKRLPNNSNFMFQKEQNELYF